MLKGPGVWPVVCGEVELPTLLLRSLTSVVDGGVNEVCDDTSLDELLRVLPRSFAGDGALSEPWGDSESLILVTRLALAGPDGPERCRFGRVYEGESELFMILKSTLMALTELGWGGSPLLYGVGLVWLWLIVGFCACESLMWNKGLQSTLSLMMTSHYRSRQIPH